MANSSTSLAQQNTSSFEPDMNTITLYRADEKLEVSLASLTPQLVAST